MLTLFSTPKPFRGHIGVIQRNAITSWTLLRPQCEIVLLGDDEGTHKAAVATNARHVQEISRNEFGTPLLSDVFAKAERESSYQIMCYINADIIVMSDLLDAVARIRTRPFLMLGRRWDLDVTEPLNFADRAWETELKRTVDRRGSLHSYLGVDYYVFSKGLWGSLPPFAVGRTVYDTWMIWRARSLGVPVIDATRVVTCVHQNHERTYSSLGIQPLEPSDDLTKGREASRNLQLAGGRRRMFSLRDSNYLLTKKRLLPALTPWYVWGHFISRLRQVLPDAVLALGRRLRSGR